MLRANLDISLDPLIELAFSSDLTLRASLLRVLVEALKTSDFLKLHGHDGGDARRHIILEVSVCHNTFGKRCRFYQGWSLP